ncbi:MAG: ImmA/IrrE family metallo-endopeptidase [Endomicrobium sp.]|jgi:Zn-dependent peptidase ImmA (M78 family)|nr:ImmA/IrrE family metallo-endopeptidase [Endomicrobium sp.]
MAIIRKFNRSTSDNGTIFANTSGDVLKLIAGKQITSRPLDVASVAKALNIGIEYKPLDSEISGILRKENDKWTVYVNNKHPETRQRFTIAHEIAHFCLHRYTKTLFEDVMFFRGTSISPEEYEANKFAGEILMPENIFREQIRQGNRKISDLAEFFGVSALALRVRAKALKMEGHGL